MTIFLKPVAFFLTATYSISLAYTLGRNEIFDFYAVSSEAIFSLAGQKNYSTQEQMGRGHNCRWEWKACNSCFGLYFKNNSKPQRCCQLICKTFPTLRHFYQLNWLYIQLSVFPSQCAMQTLHNFCCCDIISLPLSREQGLPSLQNLSSFFSNYLLKLNFAFPKLSVMSGKGYIVNT